MHITPWIWKGGGVWYAIPPLVRGIPLNPERQDPGALDAIAGGMQVQQLGAMQEPIPDLKIVQKITIN